MTSEFGHDKKHNLVRISFTGEVYVDSYEPLADFINSLPTEKKMSNLVDVSKMAGSLLSKVTREAVAGKAERVEVSLIAISGASAITRKLTKPIAAAMGRLKDTNFLKTKDEAVKWLHGEEE